MTNKKLLTQFKSEDWIIVFTGMALILLAILAPGYIPRMPKTFDSFESIASTLQIYAIVLGMTLITAKLLKRPLKKLVASFSVIFALSILSQIIASIPLMVEYGLEPVFFSVIIGLIISNCFSVPDWLRVGAQSEFYIKIGIILLGSTIIFSEVMKAGVLGLTQAFIVVFVVWYFSFWLSRKVYKVDDEMSTMLASAVSICGVSAAIATCGAINGDNKKLSYVISLVLVCAIPMMYLMPWLASAMGLSQEVAGAWMGGTIDTTGAVAASGTLIGEQAAQTAIIVKSAQNVLLGIAAFGISIFWSVKGKNKNSDERPTLATIWDRFPKFVLGFIAASLIFSFCFSLEEAKAVGKVTKSLSTTLFSIAFICIGLETRFKDIFSRENRKPFMSFMIAQVFNIFVTLIVAYILFGVVMNIDFSSYF